MAHKTEGDISQWIEKKRRERRRKEIEEMYFNPTEDSLPNGLVLPSPVSAITPPGGGQLGPVTEEAEEEEDTQTPPSDQQPLQARGRQRGGRGSKGDAQ